MAFAPPNSEKETQELGAQFAPRFDGAGLITAVTVDATTKHVLMVAHMNAQAVEATLSSGYATYWSRSRNTLWCKGETSGERQKISAIYVDCDQDALVLEVTVAGRGSACHNGYRSCFYRLVENDDGAVTLATQGTPLISADELYGTP